MSNDAGDGMRPEEGERVTAERPDEGVTPDTRFSGVDAAESAPSPADAAGDAGDAGEDLEEDLVDPSDVPDDETETPWPPPGPGRPVVLPAEYGRLEAAVRRLLEELAGYRARVRVAEDRAKEFEKTLKDVSTGALDPMKLRREVRRLEEENTELRRRMVGAQDRIRHLIARFDFLREEM